jgi:hypothetical protein
MFRVRVKMCAPASRFSLPLPQGHFRVLPREKTRAGSGRACRCDRVPGPERHRISDESFFRTDPLPVCRRVNGVNWRLADAAIGCILLGPCSRAFPDNQKYTMVGNRTPDRVYAIFNSVFLLRCQVDLLAPLSPRPGRDEAGPGQARF